jgi:hypothetical protein
MTLTIEINAVRLTVDGTYIPGEPASLHCPEYFERFEAEHVWTASGDEIGALLMDRIQEIEELALVAYLQDREANRMEEMSLFREAV